MKVTKYLRFLRCFVLLSKASNNIDTRSLKIPAIAWLLFTENGLVMLVRLT
jgi:hypothetical protein